MGRGNNGLSAQLLLKGEYVLVNGEQLHNIYVEACNTHGADNIVWSQLSTNRKRIWDAVAEAANKYGITRHYQNPFESQGIDQGQEFNTPRGEQDMSNVCASPSDSVEVLEERLAEARKREKAQKKEIKRIEKAQKARDARRKLALKTLTDVASGEIAKGAGARITAAQYLLQD